MKIIHYLSAAALLLSSASVLAGSCEVMQSRTVTTAENNDHGFGAATAGVGGKMDLSPLDGSDFSHTNPLEVYLDGQLLPDVGIASIDEVNWLTQDPIPFGSASVKNFRMVMNFNDGSTIECESDIEVRLNDADPIIYDSRFDVSETSSGVEVKVGAGGWDTDGAANVSMAYELVQGPNVSLPPVDTQYDPELPLDFSVSGQILNFSASGNYELRVRATDENGNSNVSDSVLFSIDGNCSSASNVAHVSAGRAYNFFGFVYAKGSNYWLGYYSTATQAHLQLLFPGYWVPVTGCF